MNKQEILESLFQQVRAELKAIQEASNMASSYKYDESMKQEGKYDTRAIEAGYLAGAQERRVEELKYELELIESIPVRSFMGTEKIAIGALVEMSFNGQTRTYFLSTTAGGTMLSIANKTILVISVFSPIGDAMLGLSAGDVFEVELNQSTREYEIISVS